MDTSVVDDAYAVSIILTDSLIDIMHYSTTRKTVS